MCQFFKLLLPKKLLSPAKLFHTKEEQKKEAIDFYPKRQFYPHLKYINTETFANGLYNNEYDVIDVRDEESFNTLRVKSATHIFIKNEYFEQNILNFTFDSKKKIVVYSNNLTCSKSYLASSYILEIFEKNNIEKTLFTYDTGINDFALTHKALVGKAHR